MAKTIELDVCGGCNAKLPAASLEEILKKIPTYRRDDILVGFESKDDAAVVQVTEDIGMVFTLDFFPAMVADPYIFGEIAAANSMSDVYAMGGEVVCGLNIVTFPEQGEPESLEEILLGGADKVKEAEATLVGGHSIHDNTIKYGLAVAGKVDLKNMWENNTSQVGDLLVLTKPLGVTLITNAHGLGLVSQDQYDQAIRSMTTLNKYARDLLIKYKVHAATDVTGFGFLGHLGEMTDRKVTAVINSHNVPILDGARQAADEFVLTKGGQRNRTHMEGRVDFQVEDFSLEEVLYDPQTSGGLLVSIAKEDSARAMEDLQAAGVEAQIVGEIFDYIGDDIVVVG